MNTYRLHFPYPGVDNIGRRRILTCIRYVDATDIAGAVLVAWGKIPPQVKATTTGMKAAYIKVEIGGSRPGGLRYWGWKKVYPTVRSV